MPLLEDVSTGQLLTSIIEKVASKDFEIIKRSGQFTFDWVRERQLETYKISILHPTEAIIGLMALIDYPAEARIHLNLIELAQKHRGKSKKIDRIAGCLIAYACQLAFARGYVGFVSLQPKTILIPWYEKKYGFQKYGRLLAIDQRASEDLIQEYIRYEGP
ncbi:MAG: hypothetical protein AAF399_11200 [Bacteroidota bacterium]